MDGNVPRRGRIGRARAQVLNITYLAQDDYAEHIQVNEAPPLNPSRISAEGTFGFLNKGRGEKALMDETEEEKEERLRRLEFNNALKEVRRSVSKAFGGPANRFFRKIVKEGGEEATILSEHAERNRAFLDPADFEQMPACIQECEKCLRREALAFEEWKRRLQSRIADGHLPKSVEPFIEGFDILDMFNDMKAHAVRAATVAQTKKFAEELENVPYPGLMGVLKWYNYLAYQKGEAGCDNLDELLIDTSIRAEPRDLFVLGASSRVRTYLDDTYERMMGKHRWAFRKKEDRPWHKLKDRETLDAEERGIALKDQHYMSDDQMKMLALLIAVQDRIENSITDMPALNNIEFRHSFVAASGALALEDNTDLHAAAEIAKADFSKIIGPGHPLERTLEGATVVTVADTDVGDTHVGGSSGTTTAADVSMSLGLNDRSDTVAAETLSVCAAAGRPLFEFGPSGVRDTSASAGRADAGSGDNASDARPSPYSDFRLSSRASHGEADAAGAWMPPNWSEPFHPQVGIPGGSTSPPSMASTAAAQPARPEYEDRLHTWLANNLSPAPPQRTSEVEPVKGGGKAWRPTVRTASGAQGPKSTPPRPSTAVDAWQASSSSASGSAWTQTPPPWNANWNWQEWSTPEWRDDATGRQRPVRPDRSTVPYPKAYRSTKGPGKKGSGKGSEKGKKGRGPAS